MPLLPALMPSSPNGARQSCAELSSRSQRGEGTKTKPDPADLSVVADEGRQHLSGFAPPNWCTLILFPLCDQSRDFFTAAPSAGQIRNVRRGRNSGDMQGEV